MSLKSAFEDLSQTTLEAISGYLKRLEYLAQLGQWRGDYTHWGLVKVHGRMPAKRALCDAHRTAVSEVLSTPLKALLDDVESSSRQSGIDPETYLEGLAGKESILLPQDPGAGSGRHFKSVLHALLGLERNRERTSTRRAS
jgi:hypothetical protein